MTTTSLQKTDPATGKELSAIAKLSSILRIKDPTEDKKVTHGQAGMLVRDLSAEIKRRTKLGLLKSKPSLTKRRLK